MKKTVIAFLSLAALTIGVLLVAASMDPMNPVVDQLSAFAIQVLLPACVACMPWNTTVEDKDTYPTSLKVDTKPLAAAAARGAFRLLFRRNR